MTKTIFITGGSRGIGEALVKKCAGNYNVAFTFNRSGERAKRLQDELNATYGGVFAVHCDVSDPQSVSDAAIAVKKRFGKIDILVNDAGIAKARFSSTPRCKIGAICFPSMWTAFSTSQKPCCPICFHARAARSSTCRPFGE